MPEPYALTKMSPEEIKKMMEEDPQSRQALTEKPRVGFTHNPYYSGLGKFFQKTIKNTLLEKLLDQVWQGFLRYRCHGNSAAYKDGLKAPEKVFVYDDKFLSFLNDALTEAIVEHNTDNDAVRKQRIQNKMKDIVMTMLHEDVYYRARAKLMIRDIIEKAQRDPEVLALTNHEALNYLHFSSFNAVDGFHNPEKQKSLEPLRELVKNGKGGETYHGSIRRFK
jgi:hypothetical protein